MKLNGIVGKGSGKLGASVFAISGGEQIVRQYNPQVSNPSTDAQVAQRAKLKLMSQLAAALASALAFKKSGLVSARNQFVSKNIGLATFANDAASVEVAKLQLSNGSFTIGSVEPAPSANEFDVALAGNVPAGVKTIVYVVCKKTEDAKLQVLAIQPITNLSENSHAEHTFNVPAGEYVVFAYGLKPTASSNSANYGNYAWEAADNDATLETMLKALVASSIVSETSGAEVTVPSE